MHAPLNYVSTVLIVDDAPANREALKGLLAQEGYHLVFAATGAEALESAAAVVPDLILLDVMMPGMDGYEVCRRLRADALLADVPVIMVTALDDRESRLEGIEAGADDFISKPYDRRELRLRVRTITRLNRYRRLLLEQTKFAWVVEQSAEAYLMINERDEIHYMNRQARVYLGLLPEQETSVPHTFFALAGQHYSCVPQEAWTPWPAQPHTPVSRYLVRAESATARAVWLQVEMLYLPSQSSDSMLVCLRDITAQKTLQQEVWKFQTAISHKLHTPLWGVLGCLDILAMEKAAVPPECADMVDMALSSAHRLRDEIDDVLQYLNVSSLIEPGNGCCLSVLLPLVRKICAALEIDAVSIAVPESLPPARLAFAPLTLELMLQEILENAKKFHPSQAPTIAVCVTSTDERHIRLQVCDDGATLAPEQLGRAWEPYYQGEKRLTGEVAGMGLGLAMVAALIWEKGGSCRLFNRGDGPGVVVELTLPLCAIHDMDGPLHPLI